MPLGGECNNVRILSEIIFFFFFFAYFSKQTLGSGVVLISSFYKSFKMINLFI